MVVSALIELLLFYQDSSDSSSDSGAADRQAADLAPAINEKAADNRDDLPPGLTYEAKIEGGPEALRRFLRWKGGRLRHPSCSDVIVSINGEDVRNCTVWQACVRPRPRASGSD